MRPAFLAIGLLWVASACAEALYRVPWPDGLSYSFTQVSDGRITSHFTKATLHAVDISMPVGVPVLAARAGVVQALESQHGATPEEEPLSYEGNFVRVLHDDGTAAIYAHLAYRSIAVALGEHVEAGQLLGHSGASGDVTSPHLHFGVVRVIKNSAGWPEEVSVPIKFYVGVPPVVFPPRTTLRVTANYSTAMDAPRTAGEPAPLIPWHRRALAPEEEIIAWLQLAAWLACAVAAMAAFWRFSRE